MEQVVMARKYMALDWLVKAYDKLIKRKTLINNDDLGQLGPTESFRILHLQATWWKAQMDEISCRIHSWSGTTIYARDMKQIESCDFASQIREAFRDELRRLNSHDLDSKLIGPSPPSSCLASPQLSPAESIELLPDDE
jgi:hypothetical protein